MELINNIVKDEIVKLDIADIRQLIFVSKLNNIILENRKNIKMPKYRNYLDFDKSFHYSKKFLDSISKEYGNYLVKRRNEGVFLFNNDIDSIAFSNLIDGKKVINFSIDGSIQDSYAITHEIIHDMSISENFCLNRYLFCEVVSLLSEMLQKDYFSKTDKPKDYLLNAKEVLYYLQTKSLCLDFELELINQYISTGYINKSTLKDILSKYSNEELSFVISDIECIIENEELNISYDQRYILGYTIATYIYERIQKAGSMKEFVEINDTLNIYSLEQFLTYLDLEYKNDKDLDLVDSSYEKIRKSYIKQIKTI